MRKRWIAILLGVAMSLSVMACGGEKDANSAPETKVEQNVAPAGEEQKIPETENMEEENLHVQDENTANETEFDSRLAGEWYVTSVSHDGDAEFYTNSSTFYFLATGEFWGINVKSYTDYIEAGVEPMRAYTKGNELCMWESYINTMVKGGGETQEEADKYTDMKVTYLLEDISEPSALWPGMQDEKDYYEQYDNDKLTIHITGKYQENPMTVRNINSTYVCEKKYPLFAYNDCLKPSLNGEWDDNLGNHWSFYYEKNENGYYDLNFKMTDSNEKEYLGEYIIDGRDTEDRCKETIYFVFKDFSTDKYTILSYDGKTFNFDNNGTSFVLTRK